MNHNTITHERANTRPSVLIFRGMFRAVRINPITQIFFLRYLVGHKPRRFHTMDALKDAVNNLAVSESQKQPKKKKERSN